jgi:hypothetical protein
VPPDAFFYRKTRPRHDQATVEPGTRGAARRSAPILVHRYINKYINTYIYTYIHSYSAPPRSAPILVQLSIKPPPPSMLQLIY